MHPKSFRREYICTQPSHSICYGNSSGYDYTATALPLSLSLPLSLFLPLAHTLAGERAAQAKWRNVFAFSQTRCINYRSSLYLRVRVYVYVSVCCLPPLSLLPPLLSTGAGAWGSVVKQREV